MNDFTLIIRYQQRMELLERFQASIQESQHKPGSVIDLLHKAIISDVCALIEGDREENKKARALIEEIKKEQLQGLSDLERDALRFETFGIPDVDEETVKFDEVYNPGSDSKIFIDGDFNDSYEARVQKSKHAKRKK